jgi:ABC-2 type transport system ATP-binding protein
MADATPDAIVSLCLTRTAIAAQAGRTDMTTAITTNGLTKRYRGVPALTDLTLEVPSGSIFGFLGPNGAGKTTTMKILAGLARPTSGSAEVNGIAVGPEGRHRRVIGYLAQDPRFHAWMSGRETVEYVADLHGLPASRRRTPELLDLVGLTDAADRATRTYSGGMRQRLGIAQAMAADPAVLILDEPAASLDPIGRHDILELLQRLRGTVTVFYSTHILDDVQRVSDHVAILDRGRLVVSSPTAELMGLASAGSIRVALIGGDAGTAAVLAAIPGVARVQADGNDAGEWRYTLSVDDGQGPAVQRAVMRAAADRDLLITTNRQETLDLETVFLQIVNKERAA